MHPHSPGDLPQAEHEAMVIANQCVLISQLQKRIRAQDRRIAELEMLAGFDKIALDEEIERLRQALKDLHTRTGM